MGFLSPIFLALGLGAAVPLLIHLLRRRTGVRIDFPAARYLARAEQEHSRRLKLRNLLLMLVRVLAVACIAIAAARPVSGALGRLVGAGHAPAAVAIVLDNSLSTSVVVAGRPVLDALKDVARRAARGAVVGDRVWLLTADGRTQGGTPGAIGAAIARTQPLAGAGDMPGAVARAAALVRTTAVADAVVAVVTDGQATAWANPAEAGGARIVVYAPDAPAPANRAVTAAAARPTRWTPGGEVAATVSGVASSGTGDSTTYRITLGARTLARGTVAVSGTTAAVDTAAGVPGVATRSAGGGRAASGVPPGVGSVSVHAAPAERGWVGGSVEIEPDELRGDDVRYFAFWIGEPPTLAVDSSAGQFLRGAVDALVASGRAVVAGGATGGHPIAVVAADRLAGLPALVVAPADPVRVGAANRALERAGVPWRFGAPERGEATVDGLQPGPGAAADAAPDSAAAAPPVTASLRYPLLPQSGAIADTLARTGRSAWAVAGPGFVILASPLDPASTSLPVRAVFVPWLGDVIGQRLAIGSVGLTGAAAGLLQAAPGAVVRRPAGAEELEAPDGSARVLSGATIDVPTKVGVFFLRRGGARVGALVVNPEPRESDLTRLPPATLAGRFHARGVTAESDVDRWASAIFDARAGRPLASTFLALALVLLLAEAVMTRRGAAAHRSTPASARQAA